MTDERGGESHKTTAVIAQLSYEILAGRLGAGDRLRVHELADRLGVSPTHVRSALRHLAATGAVRHVPHRGAVVAEATPQDVADSYALRAGIEGLGARFAGERATPDDLRTLQRCHDDLVAAVAAHEPAVRLAELDRAFHLEICRAGSTLLARCAASFWNTVTIQPTVDRWREPTYQPAIIDAHHRILQAVGARDARDAERLMSEHVRHPVARGRARAMPYDRDRVGR